MKQRELAAGVGVSQLRGFSAGSCPAEVCRAPACLPIRTSFAKNKE
jgi:hypothetical protein